MQHSQKIWIDRLQALYSAKYNQVQIEEIAKVLPARTDLLKAMWELVTTSFEPTSTRPLPDKAAIARVRREVTARMPDLRSPNPDTPLLDEGCFFEAHELMKELAKSLGSGEDPRDNAKAIEILNRNGYEIIRSEH